MERLVHNHIFESAGRAPEKPALVSDNGTLSYSRFSEEIAMLASLLRETGLVNGDRVGVLVRDKRDLLIAIYGAMAAGGIAVPMMEGCAPATVVSIVQDCTPRFFITSAPDLVSYPRVRHDVQVHWILMNQEQSGRHRYTVFDESLMLFDSMPQPKPLREDDGAMILYTSGTTGAKKGVLLSHRNLVQAAANINAFMKIDKNIKEFISVPLTHSFGFGRSRCVLFAGGTVVVANGMLNPVVMVRAISMHDCDAISAVPSGFAIFFDRFEPLLRRIGSQIRFIELGSSPMTVGHKRKLMEVFPHARICMHYGLTEASRSTFLEFRSEQERLKWIGKPSPNVEIGIIDERGASLDPGQEGEIVVRGEHVANGYWNNPSLTAERMIAGGWFRTGDYGSIDEEGYVRLLGRKDDMINMGGIKISPLEIEELLRQRFRSLDVCVVGYPDPEGVVGEIPVMCYASANGESFHERELTSSLADTVDRFKIPRMAVRFNALPKTENLKVKRQELRQLLQTRILKERSGV